MWFAKSEKNVSLDAQNIHYAVAILDINEFRLFELAYEEWFGVGACENILEQAFIPYLFGAEVPCWVRQYARNIRLLMQEAGVIDNRQHQLSPLAQKPRAISNSISESTLLLSLFFSMLLVIL